MMRTLVPILIVYLCAIPLFAEESAYDVLVTEPYTEESGIEQALRFYRENISRHDGARCLYYPTCSAFFGQAVDDYGLIWGVVMTLDRMVYREDHASMAHYEYIEEKGSYSDPVNHNFIFDPSGYYE